MIKKYLKITSINYKRLIFLFVCLFVFFCMVVGFTTYAISAYHHRRWEDLRQKATEYTRTVFTGSIKGLDVTNRCSNRIHSTSRLGEVRPKEVYFIHQDPVLHHHGSQHTANVSPHLVCLLRQATGCRGLNRSKPDPYGAFI